MVDLFRAYNSTPATTGVFIYLNIPRSPKNSIRYLENSIRYLAPSPTYSANFEPLFHKNKPQIFPPTAKPDTSTFHLY
jgi:hypothetical protein